MARLLKADGTDTFVYPEGKKWTLAELQKYVGGDIELMPGIGARRIIMNEYGQRLRLPINYKATEYIRTLLLETKVPLRYNPVIVGDVLILEAKEKM